MGLLAAGELVRSSKGQVKIEMARYMVAGVYPTIYHVGRPCRCTTSKVNPFGIPCHAPYHFRHRIFDVGIPCDYTLPIDVWVVAVDMYKTKIDLPPTLVPREPRWLVVQRPDPSLCRGPMAVAKAEIPAASSCH